MTAQDADLVSAALRAQEAAQVRQVEPEKRNPEQKEQPAGQEERKARQRQGDFFEKSPEGAKSGSEPAGAPESRDGDESPGPDEEPRKHINTLA